MGFLPASTSDSGGGRTSRVSSLASPLALLVVLMIVGAVAGWSPGCASAGEGSTATDASPTVTTQAPGGVEAVTDVIESYFTCYYKSIQDLAIDRAIWDYIVDNDDTHLDLCQLEYGIYWRKELQQSFIADPSVEIADVQFVKETPDGAYEVKADVRVSYRYVDGANELGGGWSGGPNAIWEVTCRPEAGRLKIVALDCPFSSDYEYAKELTAANLQQHAGDPSYTKSDAIDDAYVTIRERVDLFPRSTTTSSL